MLNGAMCDHGSAVEAGGQYRVKSELRGRENFKLNFRNQIQLQEDLWWGGKHQMQHKTEAGEPDVRHTRNQTGTGEELCVCLLLTDKPFWRVRWYKHASL